jgi:hypothetical protein
MGISIPLQEQIPVGKYLHMLSFMDVFRRHEIQARVKMKAIVPREKFKAKVPCGLNARKEFRERDPTLERRE